MVVRLLGIMVCLFLLVTPANGAQWGSTSHLDLRLGGCLAKFLHINTSDEKG